MIGGTQRRFSIYCCERATGTGVDAKGPLFNVTKRGKITYYMEGDGVISSLVTKEEADGDLLIHFAGLTGGTSKHAT